MELSAVLIRLLGFGRHSMVSYEGCMLTGRLSGAGSYLAGMAMHEDSPRLCRIGPRAGWSSRYLTARAAASGAGPSRL